MCLVNDVGGAAGAAIHQTVMTTIAFWASLVWEIGPDCAKFGYACLLPFCRRSNCTSLGGTDMTSVILNRRNVLIAGGSVLAAGVSGLLLPAHAQGLAPTRSMAGGSNNYRKGAAIVDRIGKGGFWMSGTVRRA